MTHGADPGREHSHGGSAPGIGWDLLDAVVFACAIATAILLGEMLIKARRERVRFDLTPKGRAATETPTPPQCGEGVPLIDLGKLREAAEHGDLGPYPTPVAE